MCSLNIFQHVALVNILCGARLWSFFFGIADVLLPAPATCLGWLWHLAQISIFPCAALVRA
jgi:hypothetical protein